MEFRHIKYFVKVAELLNFSEASKALFTTQSNLSKQIKQLEDELGVTLLIRDSRNVSLTDYGEYFLPYAKQILENAKASIERIKDVQDINIGTLNVGVTVSFFPLFEDTVKLFMKKFPGIKLNIFCESVENLFSKLQNRELDLVLSYKPTMKFDNISSHILFFTSLCVIVNKNHPLASQESVRLVDLEKYRLVLPVKGTQARNMLEDLTYAQNYNLNVCLETNDIHFVIDMVANNNLVTLLSKNSINGIDNLVAIPIDNNNTEMIGSYHILKGTYCRKASRELLKLLVDSNSFNQILNFE